MLCPAVYARRSIAGCNRAKSRPQSEHPSVLELVLEICRVAQAEAEEIEGGIEDATYQLPFSLQDLRVYPVEVPPPSLPSWLRRLLPVGGSLRYLAHDLA